MSENLQKNSKLVEQVFNKVYDKYDLMNDIMSLGSHRVWKKNLVAMMNPTKGRTLIDVGCGTGDIGELFSKATLNQSEILSVDPNSKMIAKAKIKHKKYENIKWKVCKGESLDVKTESFDFYTISFGLRNTGDIKKTISEAYRVLKKGGRFFCLEFSKIDNESLNFLYQQYSKFIPKIGKYIVGDSQPYEYLVKTINEFLNQEELLELIKDQKFENCSYRNLSGGIVSIHSGWKI